MGTEKQDEAKDGSVKSKRTKVETKGTAKAKTTKAPTPKKDDAPKAEKPSRVFAIRISDAELDAIHKAAGPRNATKFIRAVVAAFTSGDESAFKAVVKQAREARA